MLTAFLQRVDENFDSKSVAVEGIADSLHGLLYKLLRRASTARQGVASASTYHLQPIMEQDGNSPLQDRFDEPRATASSYHRVPASRYAIEFDRTASGQDPAYRRMTQAEVDNHVHGIALPSKRPNKRKGRKAPRTSHAAVVSDDEHRNVAGQLNDMRLDSSTGTPSSLSTQSRRGGGGAEYRLDDASHSENKSAMNPSDADGDDELLGFGQPMAVDQHDAQLARIFSNSTTIPYIPPSLQILLAPADLDQGVYFDVINEKSNPVRPDEPQVSDCFLCTCDRSDPNYIDMHNKSREIMYQGLEYVCRAITLIYEQRVRHARKQRLTNQDVIEHYQCHDADDLWIGKLSFLYYSALERELQRGTLATDVSGRNVHTIPQRLAALEKAQRMKQAAYATWVKIKEKYQKQ